MVRRFTTLPEIMKWMHDIHDRQLRQNEQLKSGNNVSNKSKSSKTYLKPKTLNLKLLLGVVSSVAKSFLVLVVTFNVFGYFRAVS